MSFPSSTGTQKGLALTYLAAKRLSTRIKQDAQTIRDAAAAGTLKRFETLRYMTRLTDALDEFTIYRSVSGIAAYAQAQEDDPTLDIVLEFTTMVNAITAARDWIVNNYPLSIGNFTETFRVTAGRYSDPGFPVGPVAPLVPLLAAIITAID